MRSAKSTICNCSRIFFIATLFLSSQKILAQENSPYSRFAAGDLSPKSNILNRGMGGVSAAYADSLNQVFGNSINLVNPASLGAMARTLFELGGEVDLRTLRSNNTPDKYNSVNTNISYLQVGIPLSSEKSRRKGNGVGMSFGLKPFSRVDYKIANDEVQNGVDTINTLYRGSGGLNMANLSLGAKFKGFSIGGTAGFMFGNKEINTEKRFFYDSLPHFNSNRQASDSYTGAFFNAGIQYEAKFDSGRSVRIGLVGNFQKNLKTSSDVVNRTIGYTSDGELYSIDTISSVKGTKGTMVLPATYSAGILYTGKHLMVGADIDYHSWSNYRYYGQSDMVKNNWTLRVGAQYFPAEINTPIRKYWNFVKYRAGFYYGPDYINLNNQQRPEYAATFGAGLPLTRLNNPDAVTLNTALEIGARGNKQNVSVRETFTKVSIGISMSARWFIKQVYY